jgi:ABC-type dipeptide/oligopeptide/nickel transport system permease subunit
MSLAPAIAPTTTVPATRGKTRAAPGFWSDAWRRFRKKPFAMAGLVYVVLLGIVALTAPVIVGTKPVVCRYKGNIYFPCLGYLHPRLENPIFRRDRFRNPFYKSLQEKDPNSWAIYPLIYQDPERRVGKEEVDGLRPPKGATAGQPPQSPGDKPAETPAQTSPAQTTPAETQPIEPSFGEPPAASFGDPPQASFDVPPAASFDPPPASGAGPGDFGNPFGDPFAGNADPSFVVEKDIDDGPPNSYHWMGVTNASRIDVLAIIIHGTKIAMLIGFVTVGISAAIGITLGAIAGYVGGWVDIVISRMTEFFMSIPVLILIIALLAVIDKPSIWQVMLVLGVTGWTSICRLTRAEFMKLRTLEYVTAARALGASVPRILFRHILPNAMAPVLVPITFGIAGAILTESGLSLLGLGSPPDTPSWGGLLNRGRENFETMWWLILFPGLAIFSTVLAYNLIGEGLQEATDPRLREGTK